MATDRERIAEVIAGIFVPWRWNRPVARSTAQRCERELAERIEAALYAAANCPSPHIQACVDAGVAALEGSDDDG